MSPFFHRVTLPLHSDILGLAPLAAVFTFALAMTCTTGAFGAEQSNLATPIAQAIDILPADYLKQQWNRLAQKTDRDSLIAAVLLGMAIATRDR